MTGRYDAGIAQTLTDGNPALDGAWLWEQIRGLIEARLQPATLPQCIAMLDGLRAHPPAPFPPETAQEIEALAQRARDLYSQTVAERVAAALVTLRENPDDQAARRSILDLGSAASPTLLAALRDVLAAEPHDAEAERRLHDLLKAIAPDWPGFPADAPIEDKRDALEKLNA